MQLFKRYYKILLILLLTVGVVCSCCSCATTSATSHNNTQQKSTAQSKTITIINDGAKALDSMIGTIGFCDDAYDICKGYSRWLDTSLSGDVITRYEWLVMLFDALDIDVTYGLDYSYSRFVDKDFFDGNEYFMTAIEKNILGPGGKEFDPNTVATRQYVSTTLVNAAGYNLNHKLICNDKKIVKDKKQAATSLYLSYLELDSDGNFNPYTAITDDETQYITSELEILKQLKGKTIMSFGDSIMHGDGNNMIGIADLLSQRYMMKAKDYSKGGATFGYAQNRQQISNQILYAIQKHQSADVILINGGTNDMHKVNAGSISGDFDYGVHGRVDYASGMEYAFGLLQDNYPNVPVVYIRAHDMVYANEANEIHYGLLALDICEKWSINTVDMFNDSDFDGHDKDIQKKYTVGTKSRPDGDSVHPTKDGYVRFYLPLVTEKILELV